MELKEFLQPYLSRWKMILLLGIIFGFTGYTISLYLPTKYKATVDVYVQRIPEKGEGEYFTYEGFYAQKAAQEYTDSVLGFLRSTDILKRAAAITGLPTGAEDLKKLQNKIRVEKQAPQLIKLEVVLKDPKSASALSVALAQATSERIKLLNQAGDQDLTIDLLSPEPSVYEAKPQKVLNATVGFGTGILLVTVAIWLKEYFGPTAHEQK